MMTELETLALVSLTQTYVIAIAIPSTALGLIAVLKTLNFKS